MEKAATQYKFIKQVAQQLDIKNISVIKGDVFKFIDTCDKQFDIIFADPPYDLPDFSKVPEMILGSSMLRPGSIVIIEHSKAYDFSALPHFTEHRVYGSVNFSIFRINAEAAD